MQTETVLLILLATIVAISVALFHYFFKNKNRGKLYITLAFLRFLGVFGILLLLINPKFSKTSYTIEKSVLTLLTDNSTSVKNSEEDIKSILSSLDNADELKNRFIINHYAFGEDLEPTDSLSFTDKLTNIYKPLSSLNEAYRRKQSTVLLISDGNQNIGRDYTYITDTSKPVYTLTVGDTTAYEDVSIGPINTNTYAFLNNKFPLETYVRYQGSGEISTKVTIRVGNKTVFSEQIRLSKSNNLKSIETLIDANTVGLKKLVVSAAQIPSEKNTVNNTRETTVEVIDEKTNVGIVSEVLHPDLGAFKKAIESNEQRKVNFLKPNSPKEKWDDTDIFILYEPTRNFSSLFDYIKNNKSSHLIVTGVNTDFNFLNKAQDNFKIELGYPAQEVFGQLNPGFSNFDISDFEISGFPPLTSDAGPITFQSVYDVLLDTEIKGVNINSPMLSIMDGNSWRKGIWLGTDIWRWRAQTYRDTGDFSNFDTFMGKLVRYLSGNSKRDRLNLEYNNLFEGSNAAIITATYFDQAYLFDPNATLNITITNKDNANSSKRSMAIMNGYYQADLSDLSPGDYEFSINVEGGNISKNGRFVISDFDLEKQFVSSDYKKMATLANNTGGSSFFSSQINQLIEELATKDTFVPRQKSVENVVSLIDYRILLAIIVLAFTLEWFLRKYNGLI